MTPIDTMTAPNTPRAAATSPSWEEVETRILAEFDGDDPGDRYAIARWRESTQKTRQLHESGEITNPFYDPAVVNAVVDFGRADIAENRAIFAAKVAKNNRLLTMMKLRVALGERQGVFIDEEDGEHLVPELLGVLRITKADKTKMLKQVVDASVKLAQSNGDGDGLEAQFPAALGDGMRDFASDLVEFIKANGERGRDVVVRVCKDHEFAQQVRGDEEMPRPLRFLAQVVLDAVTERLPEPKPKFGLAAR